MQVSGAVAPSMPALARPGHRRVARAAVVAVLRRSGLGLAIAQQLAHQHGAQLLLRSQPGRGTEALMRWLVLPPA